MPSESSTQYHAGHAAFLYFPSALWRARSRPVDCRVARRVPRARAGCGLLTAQSATASGWNAMTAKVAPCDCLRRMFRGTETGRGICTQHKLWGRRLNARTLECNASRFPKRCPTTPIASGVIQARRVATPCAPRFGITRTSGDVVIRPPTYCRRTLRASHNKT